MTEALNFAIAGMSSQHPFQSFNRPREKVQCFAFSWISTREGGGDTSYPVFIWTTGP